MAHCAAVRTSVDAAHSAYLTDTTVHRRFTHLERSRDSVSARGPDEDGVQRKTASRTSLTCGTVLIRSGAGRGREGCGREGCGRKRKAEGQVRHRAEALPPSCEASIDSNTTPRRTWNPVRQRIDKPEKSAAKETPARRALRRELRAPSHVCRIDQFPFLLVTA